jgi:hypothetical protein
MGEGCCPSLGFGVVGTGMDLGRDPSGASFFRGAVGDGERAFQLDSRKMADLDFRLRHRRREVSEHLQKTAFRLFGEVACPHLFRFAKVEPAVPALRVPPGTESSKVDSEERKPAWKIAAREPPQVGRGRGERTQGFLVG